MGLRAHRKMRGGPFFCMASPIIDANFDGTRLYAIILVWVAKQQALAAILPGELVLAGFRATMPLAGSMGILRGVWSNPSRASI
jgi:hypothetical protein